MIDRIKKVFFVIMILLQTAQLSAEFSSLENLPDTWGTDPAPLSTEAENRGTVTAANRLYARIDGDTLLLLAAGTNLQLPKRIRFFLDADNSPSTGYRKWSESGAEFMIENGTLYRSGSDSTSWEWSRNTLQNVTINIDPAGRYIETAVDLESIVGEVSEGAAYRVAFMYESDSDDPEKGYLPKSSQGMAVLYTGPAPEPMLLSSIPNGIGLGIDDLGWDSGYYRKDENGSYTEEKRNWEVADYQNVIDIGRAAGSRLMTAWVMGALDKSGITLRPEYNPPSTVSYMTGRGTRPTEISDAGKVDEVMELVRISADAIDFGIHGVSHEHYYPRHDGTVGRVRAEWAFKPDGSTGISHRYEWEEQILRMECYIELVRQYFDEETCSVPKSIVFPGHGYYYGDGTGSETTGRLMNLFGVKYANGSTKSCTTIGRGTIDNGLLFIDRGFGAAYDSIAETPWDGIDYPDGQYLPDRFGWTEAHFPNLWNTTVDDTDAFDKWVAYLTGLNDSPNRYLAPNTAQCSSQWLYRNYAGLTPVDTGSAIIDTSGIPPEAYQHDLLSTLVMKVPLKPGQHVSRAAIDKGAQIAGYHEDEFGYGYLLIGHESNPMGRLSPDTRYTLQIETGDTFPDSYVDMYKKTFNLFSRNEFDDRFEIGIEMYGTQEVKMKTSQIPVSAASTNPNLTILKASYAAPFLTLTVSGKDIQGETGKLIVKIR
jgi:hypothetical protein